MSSQKIPEDDLLIVDRVLKTYSISREEYRNLNKISKLFIQGKVSEFVNDESEKINEIFLGKKRKVEFDKVNKALDILELNSNIKLYDSLRQEFNSAKYIQSQNDFRFGITTFFIVVYLILYFTSGEEIIYGIIH